MTHSKNRTPFFRSAPQILYLKDDYTLHFTFHAILYAKSEGR